jgi:hypothetical protein
VQAYDGCGEGRAERPNDECWSRNESVRRYHRGSSPASATLLDMAGGRGYARTCVETLRKVRTNGASSFAEIARAPYARDSWSG